MDPLQHRYSLAGRLFRTFFEILAVLLPVYCLARIAARPDFSLASADYIRGLAFVVIFLSVISFILLFAAYFYSDLVSDAEGLHTRFLWIRLTIPWENVIDRVPLFTFSHQKHIWVIRVHVLSPFHLFYGLIYAFSIHPGLVYSSAIDHYEALNQRIDQASKNNQRLTH
ncbi:MAG TPA: hypothetical protein PKW33_19650 [Anaerolineaceae bacterium]|nr:hypothetical protein [Anaerolineaceae bacterium]HPN53820.1 hypothetical protein [Anaerolineaceae bacterium]